MHPILRSGLCCILLLAAAGSASGETPAGATASVEVTYLGNEGFLIAHGETKVLIDALFADGISGYPVVPKPTRQEVEAASGGFAGVDLVLASHHHDDHFNAAAVAKHLRNNPGARFVSTHQAIERLQKVAGYDAIADRARGFWPAEGERATFEHAGVELTILNLHHGRGRRPEIQNLGLLIDLGGIRLFHVGDTEVSLEDVRPYDLGAAGIDIFFAPAWFFSYDKFGPILEAVDAPVRVVMHVAEATAPARWFGEDGSRAKRLERIRRSDPEAIVFEPLESRRLP